MEAIAYDITYKIKCPNCKEIIRLKNIQDRTRCENCKEELTIVIED